MDLRRQPRNILHYLWRHKLKSAGIVYLAGSAAFGLQGLISGNPWLMGIGSASLAGNTLLIAFASGAKRSERTARQDKHARMGESLAWTCFGTIGVCFVGAGLPADALTFLPRPFNESNPTTLNEFMVAQGSATLFGTAIALWKPQPKEGFERNLTDIIQPIAQHRWQEIKQIWHCIPPLQIDGTVAFAISSLLLAGNIAMRAPLTACMGAGLYTAGAWLLTQAARASEKTTLGTQPTP